MPILSDIGAVANAVSALAGLAKPLVDNAIAQRFNNERDDWLKAWQSVAESGDAAALANFFERLLVADGQAPGIGLADGNKQGSVVKRVPVNYLNSMAVALIDHAVALKMLAAVQDQIEKVRTA